MDVRVSVGMPVYNGETFLEESLTSILNQEFEDFELLISDNASTDGTRDICERLAREDRRIRYHRFDRNWGAARNYNHVFRMSKGVYFKWASDDDVCAPAYLGRSLAALDAAPSDVVLVYPRTMLIDKDGREMGAYEDRMDVRFPQPRKRLRHIVRHLRLSNALFGLIRSSALRRTALIGGYFASDCVLLAELAMLGKFVELPERLFYRRIHEGMSLRANRLPGQISAWFDATNTRPCPLPMYRLFVEHLKRIGRAPLEPDERDWCYAVFIVEWLRRYKGRMAKDLASALAAVLASGNGARYRAERQPVASAQEDIESDYGWSR